MLYNAYKPVILANPKFYENLFHDTIFNNKGKNTSVTGINLNMLDIFEIIHQHEARFQRQCHVVVSGSVSPNYDHYDTAIYHFRNTKDPFMRISYRNSRYANKSEEFVISLVSAMSIVLFSSIMKCKFSHRLYYNNRPNYLHDYNF